MRVTSSTQFQTTYQGLNDALSRVQDLQTQMSSGRRLNRPSHPPADEVKALRLRPPPAAVSCTTAGDQSHGQQANL